MNLKALLPRISQSTLDANPQFAATETLKTNQNPVAGRTDLRNVRRGRLNKTESEYALVLEAMKRREEIWRWEFEGMTLRWADMKYTPDFTVFDEPVRNGNGEIPRLRFIEVKGAFIRDRDIVRFKGARAYWPEFQFEMWQRKKGQWTQIL